MTSLYPSLLLLTYSRFPRMTQWKCTLLCIVLLFLCLKEFVNWYWYCKLDASISACRSFDSDFLLAKRLILSYFALFTAITSHSSISIFQFFVLRFQFFFRSARKKLFLIFFKKKRSKKTEQRMRWKMIQSVKIYDDCLTKSILVNLRCIRFLNGFSCSCQSCRFKIRLAKIYLTSQPIRVAYHGNLAMKSAEKKFF